MTDIYDKYQDGLSTPVIDGDAIVIGGDQTYTNVTRALHVSTAGTIVLIMKGTKGTTKNLTMVLEVGWHPIRAVGHLAAGSSGVVGHAMW